MSVLIHVFLQRFFFKYLSVGRNGTKQYNKQPFGQPISKQLMYDTCVHSATGLLSLLAGYEEQIASMKQRFNYIEMSFVLFVVSEIGRPICCAIDFYT